jgi:hypothetical protein
VENVEQIEFSGFGQSGATGMGRISEFAGCRSPKPSNKKEKKEGHHQHERRRPANRRRGIVRMDREKEN